MQEGHHSSSEEPGPATRFTARAMVLAAADGTFGNNLRTLIYVNETDPELRAYVEQFFVLEDTATSTSWKENTQVNDKLTADMKALLAD